MTLNVQNITLCFGFNLIFQRLSFCLQPGEILQITGPNGIGKSALLKTLDGAYKPQHGHIDNNFSGKILINHCHGIKSDLLLREQFAFWSGLTGYAGSSLADWGLSELGNTPNRHLSLGQTQRLALTKLDLANAPLWLLDEPYHGLDSPGQNLLNSKIGKQVRAGGAVIIVSHNKLDLIPNQIMDMQGLNDVTS